MDNCEDVRGGRGGDALAGAVGAVVTRRHAGTGTPELDALLPDRRWPHGLVAVSGPEGAGKTLLAMRAVVEAQSAGQSAAWVDRDALRARWARLREEGVAVERLLVSVPEPDPVTHAWTVLETLLRVCGVRLVVLSGIAPCDHAALRQVSLAAREARATVLVVVDDPARGNPDQAVVRARLAALRCHTELYLRLAREGDEVLVHRHVPRDLPCAVRWNDGDGYDEDDPDPYDWPEEPDLGREDPDEERPWL